MPAPTSVARRKPRLRVPDELAQLNVELGMWDSLRHHLWYGLHPGSYGEAILLGNYDLAIQRSHELIRIWIKEYDLDVTAAMIRCVGTWPDLCRGDAERIRQWEQRGGLDDQPQLWPLFRLAL